MRHMFEGTLARQYSNRLQLVVLLLIWSLSNWIVSFFADDLSNPVSFAAVIPLGVIYALEKIRLMSWFSGLTLPVLAVVISAHLFLWIGHRVPYSSSWAISGTCIALVLSLCFLMVRLWTWDNRNRTVT
ncbi:hypothetical protein V474_17665 [Novosphingobium barchaimii LL02]|uniref:Uncharacterized protein n=1 Tax=Novosphingobium barchaimii LL02 TaxID=1114963 RepID=A0A0J7XV22_9SPHN|nr:hypothetical protein V474_17665 [Novosphingobium barchaimii LL02]